MQAESREYKIVAGEGVGPGVARIVTTTDRGARRILSRERSAGRWASAYVREGGVARNIETDEPRDW